MTLIDDRAVRDAVHGESNSEAQTLAAAGCALVAGGIHLAVIPEHLAESWPMSVFFLVVGLAQLGLAAALRWQLPAFLVAAVIAAHLGVIALYVASRTVDLPFVPPHGSGHNIDHLPVAGGVGNGIPVYPGSRIEPVGVLDVTCLIAELVLVAILAGMLPPRWRALMTSVMLALGVLAIVWRGTGVWS